jgi:hypothetical protein
MNETELDRRFPDLKGSQKALQRAAMRARDLAEKTGTQLVVASRKQSVSVKKVADCKR